ncbi:MAG TPA: hypothetical protein VF629_14510 [Hymenobacter sp.]|jgi:hypothetical protein|uniref:hypothetical protein n=1 Tax=Hymenobacter sp. TaxID=1898978 RepID=UPI002EDBB4D7
MKILFAAALYSGLSFAAVSVAHAQTGPVFPSSGRGTSEEGARRNTGNNAQELARNQRRASMTPEEIKQDQQMALLEARTGNTSFGRNGGPERQFDSNRSGNGFMVRKFKSQPGKPGYMSQKRGMSHPVGASNPKGKPLVHKRKSKKQFLLF